MLDVPSEIRAYLVEEVFCGVDESALSFDAPLVERGILDSLVIQSLIMFLEERFNVVLRREDFVPDNFETINRIASLVRARGEA